MKSIKELSQELEAVCQRIQAEPQPLDQIRMAATVRWLAQEMQKACVSELDSMRTVRPIVTPRRVGVELVHLNRAACGLQEERDGDKMERVKTASGYKLISRGELARQKAVYDQQAFTTQPE